MSEQGLRVPFIPKQDAEEAAAIRFGDFIMPFWPNGETRGSSNSVQSASSSNYGKSRSSRKPTRMQPIFIAMFFSLWSSG